MLPEVHVRQRLTHAEANVHQVVPSFLTFPTSQNMLLPGGDHFDLTGL
jgi:hypothetical protein